MQLLNARRSWGQLRLSAKSLVLLASTLVGAGGAMAADGVVATLEQPLSGKKEVIVESALFRCEGSTCVLSSNSDGARSTGTCHALERKVGPLVSYVVAGKPFESDKLAKCNGN